MEIPHKGTSGAIWIAAVVATVLGAYWISGNDSIAEEQSIMRACIVFPYSMVVSRQIVPSMLALALSAIQFHVYGFGLYLADSRGWLWRACLIFLAVHGVAILISMSIRM